MLSSGRPVAESWLEPAPDSNPHPTSCVHNIVPVPLRCAITIAAALIAALIAAAIAAAVAAAAVVAVAPVSR
jgi:hypothetical protein